MRRAYILVVIGIRNLLRVGAALVVAVSSVWDRVDRYRLVAALNISGRLDRLTYGQDSEVYS